MAHFCTDLLYTFAYLCTILQISTLSLTDRHTEGDTALRTKLKKTETKLNTVAGPANHICIAHTACTVFTQLKCSFCLLLYQRWILAHLISGTPHPIHQRSPPGHKLMVRTVMNGQHRHLTLNKDDWHRHQAYISIRVHLVKGSFLIHEVKNEGKKQA